MTPDYSAPFQHPLFVSPDVSQCLPVSPVDSQRLQLTKFTPPPTRTPLTDSEDTCFFFDVNDAAGDGAAERAFLGKDGALERFASFFSGPLFTASAAGRELNAVDSEHRKNLQQDVWRLGQVCQLLYLYQGGNAVGFLPPLPRHVAVVL